MQSVRKDLHLNYSSRAAEANRHISWHIPLYRVVDTIKCEITQPQLLTTQTLDGCKSPAAQCCEKRSINNVPLQAINSARWRQSDRGNKAARALSRLMNHKDQLFLLYSEHASKLMAPRVTCITPIINPHVDVAGLFLTKPCLVYRVSSVPVLLLPAGVINSAAIFRISCTIKLHFGAERRERGVRSVFMWHNATWTARQHPEHMHFVCKR